MGWLFSAVGVVLVAAVARDVFLTIWFPNGSGPIEWSVSRLLWRSAHGGPHWLRRLVGPCILATIILTWGTLAALGWALVYVPHMDESFLFATGLDASARSDLADAAYFSLVTIATLGYGDIVGTEGWIRFLSPLEALMGFALLSASVTWVLQIYPALIRRRTLAEQLRTLEEQDMADRLHAIDSPALASLLLDLSSSVSGARVDLAVHHQTYFFWDEPEGSLAETSRYALEVARTAATHPRDDVRLAAACCAPRSTTSPGCCGTTSSPRRQRRRPRSRPTGATTRRADLIASGDRLRRSAPETPPHRPADPPPRPPPHR
jgi:hypothetical protein